MEYKEFISRLQKELGEKKQELGYDKMDFLEDGFTSSDEKELSIIRETNIKYYKTESDVLIGDYVILYQYKGKREQMCRFDCGQLYREHEKGGWEAVWEQIFSSIESSRKFMELEIMDLIEKNEYGLLKDKLFIRPLNFKDHRYELKDHIYRRIGDMVLVLYILASDENDGKRHDVMSIKVPKISMQEWGMEEEEVWENAMSNTYIMAPPRMYLKPMDSFNPPYHRGAFMALNSDITSLPPLAVPTVTTTAQINGAIAMFYPGVMKRIAELFGDDYYIAFTGTSEARLHKKGTIQPRNILMRIKRMNKTFDPSETLSNKVYLYETANQELRQLEL
ncbi:DUF5688 family protein [uncultured Acetatifactor sp.]|uniref:DUF5688 family protein n=1 Tax=uncultured Acetatifactor sp. TaxID=1671927 RepID=UPI002611B97E|nr:DUF5688 family protein [uncultured Acetatifactor sp.]